METRTYCLMIEGEDNLLVKVKDDVNRPNNDDCDTVLQTWIHENYGDRKYEYVDIESIEVVEL